MLASFGLWTGFAGRLAEFPCAELAIEQAVPRMSH
jgi:hypothetical protein